VTLHELGYALGLGHTTNLLDSYDLMGYGGGLGDPVLDRTAHRLSAGLAPCGGHVCDTADRARSTGGLRRCTVTPPLTLTGRLATSTIRR
jgi:hypothetical protein